MFASGIKSRKKCLLVGGDAKAELLDYFMKREDEDEKGVAPSPPWINFVVGDSRFSSISFQI